MGRSCTSAHWDSPAWAPASPTASAGCALTLRAFSQWDPEVVANTTFDFASQGSGTLKYFPFINPEWLDCPEKRHRLHGRRHAGNRRPGQRAALPGARRAHRGQRPRGLNRRAGCAPAWVYSCDKTTARRARVQQGAGLALRACRRGGHGHTVDHRGIALPVSLQHRIGRFRLQAASARRLPSDRRNAATAAVPRRRRPAGGNGSRRLHRGS